MKNILKKVLSVAAATALLMTSVVSASAADPHEHKGAGTAIKPDTDEKTYTITLNAPTDATAPSHLHYAAYQIFSGSVPAEDDESYPGKDDYTNPGNTVTKLPITDIKFGNAFGDPGSKIWQDQIAEFVFALGTMNKDATYGYAFSKITQFNDFVNPAHTKGDAATAVLNSRFYKDPSSVKNEDIDFDYLAQAVAGVIAEQTDRQWLQAFADILGGFANAGSGDGTYLNKGFINDNSKYYEGADDASSYPYKIEVPAGYYMVVDLSEIDLDADNDNDEAFSARMLMVASDVEQEVKSSVPELTKEILRKDGDEYKPGTDPVTGSYDTDAAGVGDIVKFKLTGTLPSNYDNYLGGYQYTFIDTLENGLAFEDEPVITVTGLLQKADGSYADITELTAAFPDGKAIITEDSFKNVTSSTHSTPHLTDKAYNLSYDGKIMTLEFPCLKEIELTGEDGEKYSLGYNDGKSSIINVEYSVKVTDDAVVGDVGNKNKAQIKYSNNPQAYDDTDYTTEEISTVYSFGLKLTKNDAASFIKHNSDSTTNPTVEALSDVRFALLRPAVSGTADTYDIATFVTNLDGSFEISEWKADAITYTSTTTAKELRKAISDYNETYAGSYFVSTSATGELNILGLDDEIEYTLVETKTHDNASYAFIDPFTFKLVAAMNELSPNTDEYTGLISSSTVDHELSAESSEASLEKYVINKEDEDEDTDGYGDITVLNFKYTDLPSTGGIGVYIYYIAGGCVVALALVLFALSKKKKTTK